MLRVSVSFAVAMALVMGGAGRVFARDANSLNEVLVQESPLEAQFSCGGRLERAIWALWEDVGRDYLIERQILGGIVEKGDPYALYDSQVIFQNLEAMARRCDRPERLAELADILLPVFDMLEALPGEPEAAAWLCRGGRVCNKHNGLLGREMMLASLQGLGLLSVLARDLVNSGAPLDRHPLVARTVRAAVSHLQRWGNEKARAKWRRLAELTPADVEYGRLGGGFTDKQLWQIAIYANLAGIAMKSPELFEKWKPDTAEHQAMAGAISDLLGLFIRRIVTTSIRQSRIGRIEAAELDAGFWGLHGDNRYAGYYGKTPPARCVPEQLEAAEGQVSRVGAEAYRPTKGSAARRMRAEVVIPADKAFALEDLGWDISHGRRLVHVLDALNSNRDALIEWWGLSSNQMVSERTAKAFAAQLVIRVWNGDEDAPLFRNFWSGANGWYRVGYDNGTGTCYSGYPPFGLTDSFVSGGYVQWAKYYSLLGDLGRKIFWLTQSNSPSDREFIGKYYYKLTDRVSPASRMVNEMMFWPSLVN